MLRGVDISSHQVSTAINWQKLAESHQFVICRGTYGTRRDTRCAEHVRRAQDVGLTCGLYHFFRPQQSTDDQLAAFGEMADDLGMGAGWVVPALDVERNEAFDGPFTPGRYVDQCHEIAETWENTWGTPLLYVNPSDWLTLGSPAWLTDYLLWLADWSPPADSPLNHAWTIWQHTVAPLPGIYEKDIDQDWCEHLPILGGSNVVA